MITGGWDVRFLYVFSIGVSYFVFIEILLRRSLNRNVFIWRVFGSFGRLGF